MPSGIELVLAPLTPETPIEARAEMKLRAALGASLLFTQGAVPAARQACAAALRLAESLGDTEQQLRALWELWVHHTNTGEHVAALALAEKFQMVALDHGDPATLPVADRIIGMSYHYLADQTNAWRNIERMLSADVDPRRPSRSSGSGSIKRSPAGSLSRGSSGSEVSPTRHGTRCEARMATRRRSRTRPRYVTRSATAGALSRCGREIWPRRIVTRNCCSIFRGSTVSRSGMISPPA